VVDGSVANWLARPSGSTEEDRSKHPVNPDEGTIGLGTFGTIGKGKTQNSKGKSRRERAPEVIPGSSRNP
jgi:hypothetical protein